MKESYDSMHHLVKHNQYNKYSWHMCGDLKVITHLLDLLIHYMKFCCSLSAWEDNSSQKQPPFLQSLIPVQKLVTSQPLINPYNIFLPLFCNKLGLVRKSIRIRTKTAQVSLLKIRI